MHGTDPRLCGEGRESSTARSTAVQDRLDAIERRLDRLEAAVCSMSTTAGDRTVAGSCCRCEAGVLVAAGGFLECTGCDYRRTL